MDQEVRETYSDVLWRNIWDVGLNRDAECSTEGICE